LSLVAVAVVQVAVLVVVLVVFSTQVNQQQWDPIQLQ
jgi:hypothetical protein